MLEPVVPNRRMFCPIHSPPPDASGNKSGDFRNVTMTGEGRWVRVPIFLQAIDATFSAVPHIKDCPFPRNAMSIATLFTNSWLSIYLMLFRDSPT